MLLRRIVTVSIVVLMIVAAFGASRPGSFAGLSRSEWWLVIIGGLTLGVVAWQAYETRRTADAAAKQSAIASDTAQRQLRAYVLVSFALLKFPDPTTPEVQVHFKNYGQTPAYDFCGAIGMWIGDYPLNVVLPPPPASILKGVEPLAPSRASIHVIKRNPPVAAQYVSLLGTIKATIWVFGEMTYKDAFGEKRYLKYRLMFGGPGGTRPIKDEKGNIKGYLLNPDTEGNEAN